MTIGWLFLALGAAGYGVAHFLQASAACNSPTPMADHQGFFRKLARNRAYWFGVSAQLVAATCAVVARKDLPLFLVQAALAASIGLTALLGVSLLSWRLPFVEICLLISMAGGLTMLIASARGSSSLALSAPAIAVLAALPLLLGVGGYFALRLHGTVGSAVLGALAGLAFSAAAVSSRPLANLHSITALITSPLLYILIVNAALAQLTLAQAFRRGSATAAICAMDAAGAVPAALVGILLLGDSVRPGFQLIAMAGFALTLTSVLGLARYAQPQTQLAKHAHPPSPPTRRRSTSLAKAHASAG